MQVAEMNKQTQLAGQNREKENKASCEWWESHLRLEETGGRFMALGLPQQHLID